MIITGRREGKLKEVADRIRKVRHMMHIHAPIQIHFRPAHSHTHQGGPQSANPCPVAGPAGTNLSHQTASETENEDEREIDGPHMRVGYEGCGRFSLSVFSRTSARSQHLSPDTYVILALTLFLESLPSDFQDVTLLVNNAGLVLGVNAADSTPMEDVSQVHAQDTQWVLS